MSNGKISIQLPDPTPMTFTEFATKLESSGISRDQPKTVLNFCFCDFECAFEEDVFVDPLDDDNDKNDRTSILVQLEDLSLDFTIELNTPDGQTIALNDNTYGTYFPKNYVPTNPLKGGFLCDWRLVQAAFGYGKYTITLTENLFSGPRVSESWVYWVQPYDEEEVDGTIRIETISNGCINQGIDYTDLNWFRSIRLSGKVAQKEYILDTTRALTSTYQSKQVRASVQDQYTMEIRQVPEEVLNPLLKDHLLGNTVQVNDYNVWNFEVIRALDIFIDEIGDLIDEEGTKNATVTLKCLLTDQSNIKRN